MDTRAIFAASSEEAQTVSRAVRDQFLEPFITAVDLTLREWASTEVVVQSVFRTKHYQVLGAVASRLDLRFRNPGALVLAFSEQTATALARRILNGTSVACDLGMAGDCVGETANVIAGHAKAILAPTPYAFAFSTPTQLTTGQEVVMDADSDCLVILFGSDLGEFLLQLFVNPALLTALDAG